MSDDEVHAENARVERGGEGGRGPGFRCGWWCPSRRGVAGDHPARANEQRRWAVDREGKGGFGGRVRVHLARVRVCCAIDGPWHLQSARASLFRMLMRFRFRERWQRAEPRSG